MNQTPKTIIGQILDNFWLGTFLCLLTLFFFLTWAIVEIQNHYYFSTVPFSPMLQRIP